MKPLIKENGNGRIELDFVLILPDGWELALEECDINTSERTITPRHSKAVFTIRPKTVSADRFHESVEKLMKREA